MSNAKEINPNGGEPTSKPIFVPRPYKAPKAKKPKAAKAESRPLSVKKSVLVTVNPQNDLKTGECMCCGAKGYVAEAMYGYPYTTANVHQNNLHHMDSCPLNTRIDQHGRALYERVIKDDDED